MRLLALALIIAASIALIGIMSEAFTPQQVAASYPTLAGRHVSVEGYAKLTRTICTQIACAPENPCCNACSYKLSLENGGYFVEVRGKGNSLCQGDSCSANCTLSEGRLYAVSGTLREEDGKPFIELEGYTAK